MDINTLFALNQAWDKFKQAHPRFPPFLKAARQRGLTEGTDIFISVTYPDGQTLKAGLKLKADDIELFDSLHELMR